MQSPYQVEQKANCYEIEGHKNGSADIGRLGVFVSGQQMSVEGQYHQMLQNCEGIPKYSLIFHACKNEHK